LFALSSKNHTLPARNFSHIIQFQNINDYKKALVFLKKTTKCNPSTPNGPYKIFSDLNQQLQIAYPYRHFREMNFNDIKRMQFDIETLTTDGYEFSNAKREEDSICMISLSDNRGWEECLQLNNPFSEKEMIEKFIEIIQKQDPDVIEGHNIFNFDLPYIEERAKRYKLKLILGRNNAILKKRSSRFNIADKTISYMKYEIFGRHIIDTFHLVQHYDAIHRDLESYSLKSVARHFGVASQNRVYIEGEKISKTFFSDPQHLRHYALDDVRETAAISEILSPSYFYMTQLLPISYQNCIIRGNATKIDALLQDYYIKANTPIPFPEAPQAISGGLTGAPSKGIFRNVWHCDIRSLYPSIIIAENWIPQRDSLGIFTKHLKTLRKFRLKAKDAEKASDTPDLKREFNAIQTTFKILINSFYGYLGFAQGTFNDYKMADRITTKGRNLLEAMINYLEKENAVIIEMDTDGIYFQPPKNSNLTPSEMGEKIQSILPKGIEVELDAVYSAMFCYKSKNYALMNEEREISITGAALKSRGLEPFQRDFLKEFLRLLLLNNLEEINNLIKHYRNIISNQSIPLEKLAKTVNLKENPENYRKKLKEGKGKRNAAYELALSASRRYTQGDQISYIVTGTKKRVSVVDNSILLNTLNNERIENTAYYLEKLEELYGKFKNFLPSNDPQMEFSF